MPEDLSPTEIAAPQTVRAPVTTLWTDPGDVCDLDAPMLDDRPDPASWLESLTQSDKHNLGRCQTQLLYGEPVQVLQRQGRFVRVIAPWQPSSLDPRGYPGWVPTAHLGDPAAETEMVAIVTASTSSLVDTHGASMTVSYATVLPVQDTSATHVRVELPDGGLGMLPAKDVDVGAAPTVDHRVDPAEALAQARRFIGLEYLWGGMSAYGLDCSGLVHIAFRRLGALVPRDAHDQADVLPTVALSAVTAGDLLFFARPDRPIHHVGFATGAPQGMVHAPGTGNPVEEGTMNVERQQTLVGAARVGVRR